MLKNIINYVIRETGQNILNPDRQRDRIDARTLYYVLAKENTSYSYAKIGKVVGKSHASVMHSYLKNADQMFLCNPDYKEIYDKYNTVSDFSSQLDLVEKVLDLEFKVLQLSKNYTDNELVYRDLCYKHQCEYDRKAKWVLESFEWKDREANRKEVFEIVKCSQ